jgi:hypothetical protein
MAAAGLVAGIAVVAQRRPELGIAGRGKVETGGQHADYGARVAVERHGTPQDGRIAGVAFLPGGIAQYDRARRPRRILARAKIAAQSRRHTQRLEKLGGHSCTAHHFRDGVRAERETIVLECIHGGKNFVEPFPIQVVGIRKRAARAELDRLEQAGQTGGIAVGQRLDQGGVYKREDGYAGAHAQAQHQDRGAGEAGVLAQVADRIARIPQQVFEERDAAAVAPSLLGGFDAAQLQNGIAARLVRGHAGAQVVGGVQLQMSFDFIRHLAIPAGGWQQAGEADQPCAQPLHIASPEGARKRARMVVACCQSRASFSSCLRPRRVSL